MKAKQYRTYNCWYNMIAGCSVPSNISFKHYGAKGITVCKRWLESFQNFLADMGEKPAGLTLERKSARGNYEPRNCIWATYRTQANNRNNNHIVTFGGETKTMTEMARLAGISERVAFSRYNKGWSTRRIFMQPIRRKLTRQQQEEIIHRYKSGEKRKDIAKEFGIAGRHVWYLVNRLKHFTAPPAPAPGEP